MIGLRSIAALFVRPWTTFWLRNYNPLGPPDVIIKHATRHANWRNR